MYSSQRIELNDEDVCYNSRPSPNARTTECERHQNPPVPANPFTPTRNVVPLVLKVYAEL